MKSKDLNKLIGSNLRTLRLDSKMTQEQLAERLGVSCSLVPTWEAGSKGIGKKVLLKLCELFSVKPYIFYMDESASVIINTRERKILYRVREAEKLGVSDHIEEYCDFVVDRAKKK